MKRNTFFPTIVLFLLSLLMLVTGGTGCRKDDDDSNHPDSPYIGAWEITFDGACVNSKTVIINEDRSFGFFSELRRDANGQNSQLPCP